MNAAEDALMGALAEHGGGHGYRVAAREALSLLGQRGWSLVQIDPFAAADPPPGCCGGWVGPNGQRTMCCPVASPSPSDEALADALDAFQGAAESYGYDRTEGTAVEQRRSRERMDNTRLALVRLITGERASSTNAPAIGGADAEPGGSCGICEGMCCGSDVLTDRQGVLDAFAERLTSIEDWVDRQDEGWRFR